jgi:Cu/Ag efflux protein CusF
MKKEFVVAAALLGAVSLPAVAQQKPEAKGAVVTSTEPGKGTIATTVSVSATVTAIDQATREVTLKGPEGREVTVVAGPEVRNLAQVKVGDLVTVRYVEALTLSLKKGGKELRAAKESETAERAKAGEKPGAAAARRVEVTADVIAVDAKTQTVTLRGPKRTVDLKLRDPEQFKLVKVGDQVQATYTEAVALAVEAAAPAKK